MACYVPFSNRNLEVNFFVLRPAVICVDDIVEALKQFSSYTESLNCVYSSILRSIHGNMIIWYGAWRKMTHDKKQILSDTLVSMLSNHVSSMAILLEHSFFEAYAGESRDGSPAAKFFTGDIVSMSLATLSPKDRNSNENDVSYACLAIFKDRFKKMDGARAGVCFKSQSNPRVVTLLAWKSLQLCYSFILTSDYRHTILPFLGGLALDIKYDVFRVVYVSGHSGTSVPDQERRIVGREIEKKSEAYPVASFQDFKGR